MCWGAVLGCGTEGVSHPRRKKESCSDSSHRIVEHFGRIGETKRTESVETVSEIWSQSLKTFQILVSVPTSGRRSHYVLGISGIYSQLALINETNDFIR